MINTPLFGSLERQARLLAVLRELHNLCERLSNAETKEIMYYINAAIDRERTFLESNIGQWLESFEEKL